jgi:ssDNA-binding Zn-finger/Zn-ribbon topoisomerase 1
MERDTFKYFIVPFLGGPELGKIAQVSRECHEIARRDPRWYEFSHYWSRNMTFTQACKYGHLMIAKHILTTGSMTQREEYESFCLACQNGHLNIMKWLYSLGVNVHIKDDRPLYLTIANSHLSASKWLIENGATPDIQTISKLFYSNCRYGTCKMVEWMLTFDIYTNWNFAFGAACFRKCPRIAKLLLKRGADIRACPGILKTTYTNGRLEFTEWLIEMGANVNEFRNSLLEMGVEWVHLQTRECIINFLDQCKKTNPGASIEFERKVRQVELL